MKNKNLNLKDRGIESVETREDGSQIIIYRPLISIVNRKEYVKQLKKIRKRLHLKKGEPIPDEEITNMHTITKVEFISEVIATESEH